MGDALPANSVLFSDLCFVYEKLGKSKRQKHEQDKILTNFINEFRISVAGQPGLKNSSFFPILRLLLPNEDRDRCAYNIKEKKLAELIVSVAMNKHSSETKKILEFRSASKSSECDLPSVAYYHIKKRFEQKAKCLTVGQVNLLLDDIANAEVGSKREIQERSLLRMFKNTDANEAKWFLRLILKDLKLGMGHVRVLAAFHPDAPEVYETCKNLAKVCEELEDGNLRPLELGLEVFYAVSPMLSERLDITEIGKKLPTNKLYQLEEKFDGERFQIHMDKGVFEYFSRRGHKYAENYGATFASGSLTPFLKDCFSPSTTSFILDGEMMGWHKYHNYFSSKGLSFDVKKITDKSKFKPCFCAFDVLYYNGECLIGGPEKGGRPLKERLKILDAIFKDVPGAIVHSKRQIVSDNAEILEALNKAIEEQSEGIVVKDVDSYYIANRRNAGWYKIKPEYTESTMTDLDVVIIGADEAENKRQGRAKSFHIACADGLPGQQPNVWISIGRVATGFTFEEREKVCKLLEAKWTPYKRKPAPANLVFNKETPDFWLMPEHSVVLTVRASELIRSTGFGTPYTLRFPRVVSIREDKPVHQIMTLQEFQQLVADKGPVVKLGSKRVADAQLGGGALPTAKKRVAAPARVAEQFVPSAVEAEQVVSNALKDRKICILNDDEAFNKDEMSRIIKSHGGKIVANNGADTWCCIVCRITPRVRGIMCSGAADVITASWLRSIPDSDVPIQLSPADMLAMRKSTRMEMARKYDRYGDSYTEPVDLEMLKKCLDKVGRDEQQIHLTNQEMVELDNELFGDNNPHSFLRPCFLYIEDVDSLLSIKARLYAANLCSLSSNKLTHVVVSNLSNTQKYMEQVTTNAVIVSEDWLKRCFEEGRLVSEHDFVINT